MSHLNECGFRALWRGGALRRSLSAGPVCASAKEFENGLMSIRERPDSRRDHPDAGPSCDGSQEHPTGSGVGRLRTLSTCFPDLVDDILWLTEKRLQAIEEVALDPQGSGTVGSQIQDANDRLYRARKQGDREAEDEALVDLIRAQMREWWPDFPKRQLLADMYRRADRRKEGCGSDDSRRRPSHSECLRVARCLLADVVPGTGRFDPESESRAVTESLIRYWMFHTGLSQTLLIDDFIEHSKDSRAYFDALWNLAELLVSLGAGLPVRLRRWSLECALGRRRRPPLPSLPAHRPVNSENLVRDVQIHFTIEILERVGVAPRGSPVSGCRIVSEVLELSEDSVTRIWKRRIGKSHFDDVLLSRNKAVAERTGFGLDGEA